MLFPEEVFLSIANDPPRSSLLTQTLPPVQSLTAYRGQGIRVQVNELKATGGHNRVSATGVLELNGGW